MTTSIIDFSAQFGGRDAAASVLPHFKALKAAARGIKLEGFPFPELAYILRVDGEVNQYGLVGSGDLDIDKDGDYLSVDIGIGIEDRARVSDVVIDAILSSAEQIKDTLKSHSLDVDFRALQQSLRELTACYRNQLIGSV